jgi:hypothetical protein
VIVHPGSGLRSPCIANTFVELADTLVADFDLVEFLHLVAMRTQQTLGVEAVGLLLADNHGGNQKLTDVADAVVRNDPAVADLVNGTGDSPTA